MLDMRYLLTLATGGSPPEINITGDRFFRLKSAKAILTQALAVEEKYEMVISNFLDLEKESNNIALSNMVRNHHEYLDSFDFRLV